MGEKDSAVPLRYRCGHFTWRYVRPTAATLEFKDRKVKVNHQVEDRPANDKMVCFHKHILGKVEISKMFVSRRVLETWKKYMFAVLYVLNKEPAGKRKRLDWWDCGFESRRGHGCLLWILCEVRYRPLRRSDPSSRGVLPSVSLNVIRCNINPLHLQWVRRRGKTTKGRNRNYSAPLIGYRYEIMKTSCV